MTTLSLNLKINAATQFINYNYKNFVTVGGITYGLNDSGIFSLDTADTDNGIAVGAYFSLIMTNLGISNQKRIRSGYISGEGGSINVTIKFDDDSEHTTEVTPVNTAQGAGKFNGIRSQKGEYFQIKIQNINGSDFSIDQIDVTPIILGLKPSGNV